MLHCCQGHVQRSTGHPQGRIRPIVQGILHRHDQSSCGR